MPTDFDKGLALHQQGRLAEAEQCYRRMLRTAPTHFDALHLLGVIAGQTNRFDEAHELLTRALKQRPQSAPALNNLGNTLGSLGRHEEAVQAFERALAVRPDDAKALRNRGTSLRALEKPVEALASFDAALALQPDYAEALIGRAEALLTLHRRSQAIDTFRQALALGKDVEQIRYALASLGDGPAPATAPPDYVEALFDMYAHNFDQHLVERLGYRTPELLVTELMAAQPPTGADVIDLGCGTGLCGPLLRPLARQLAGVDLSSMTSSSRARSRPCCSSARRASTSPSRPMSSSTSATSTACSPPRPRRCGRAACSPSRSRPATARSTSASARRAAMPIRWPICSDWRPRMAWPPRPRGAASSARRTTRAWRAGWW
jgi:predicted TPR repeat methyltransferase